MDVFYECMVKRKMTAFDWVKIIAAGVLALAVTAFIVMLFLNGITLGGMFLLIIAFVWWGFVTLARGMSVEYEYAITNTELDIDMIRGKSRRKHITTINLKTIGFFAKKDDPRIKDKISDKIKEYYLVGDRKSNNIYVTEVISKKNNERIRVFIEPDEELTKAIENANQKAAKLFGEGAV